MKLHSVYQKKGILIQYSTIFYNIQFSTPVLNKIHQMFYSIMTDAICFKQNAYILYTIFSIQKSYKKLIGRLFYKELK